VKIKITAIEETRYRTTYTKDAYGNRHRGQEAYTTNRIVKTVAEGPRFGHYFVDCICYYVLLIFIGFLVEFLRIATNTNDYTSVTTNLLLSLLYLLGYPLYYFLCEFLWQKTPGKFLTRTIVVNEYGEKPSTRALLFRSLIRFVPFEAFSCFNNRQKQSLGWHDRWTNTFVIPDEELNDLKSLLELENMQAHHEA
jgi:uncharacterized RDD family membrane protein YckC